MIAGTRHDSPELMVSTRKLTRPMGVAVQPESGNLAVAVDVQIWQFGNTPEFLARVDPTDLRRVLPAAQAIYTGPIDAHEIAWCGGELWVVNTLFSCLCTLNVRHNFVPRWKPRFVTALTADDRCHLNGLAVADGRPSFVTALGETDTREGWRPSKATGGCVVEVASGKAVVQGLSMPHSPHQVRRALAPGIGPWATRPSGPSEVRGRADCRDARLCPRLGIRGPVRIRRPLEASPVVGSEIDLRQPADLGAVDPAKLRRFGLGPG